MPGRRNPPAKWVLPVVVNPPDRLCITIPVPNDRQHIGAFWGALYNLTSARFWQDDLDHTALLVAKVWQDIYDSLKPDSCDITPSLAIEEWEDMLSICESLRFQDGKLQGLCCGEWVDIAGQGDSSLGGPGQPGGGADQPAPDGGQACYHGNMQAAYQWLAPTVVNAGDVLTFSNFDGAAWDAVAPFPLPGRWDCPDGRFFFAGVCQDGTQTLVGGDPLPTAPHMSLIAQIAGTWYSCLTPITVPGGVSNAQVMVQLNDATIGDNSGQYAFDMCVTNNQSAAWSHIISLTGSPRGFAIVNGFSCSSGSWGVYTPGSGFQVANCLNATTYYRILQIKWIFSADVHFTSCQFVFDAVLGTHLLSGNHKVGVESIDAGGTVTMLNDHNVVTGTAEVADALTAFTCRGLGLRLGVDSVDTPTLPDGSATVYSLRVAGTGYDPFSAL